MPRSTTAPSSAGLRRLVAGLVDEVVEARILRGRAFLSDGAPRGEEQRDGEPESHFVSSHGLSSRAHGLPAVPLTTYETRGGRFKVAYDSQTES